MTRRPGLLLTTISVLGAIACFILWRAARKTCLGAVTGSQAQHVASSTDSEYRFISGVWFSLGCASWWSLRKPTQRAATTRLFLLVALGGGLSRLLGVVLAGNPGPVFLAALAVELVIVPAVLVLHRRNFPPPTATDTTQQRARRGPNSPR